MKIDAKTLREIRQQTAINDHGGALLTAAQALGCAKIAERLIVINRQHRELGDLTIRLYHERHLVSEELMRAAREVLSDSDYQKFHDAF